MHPTRKIELIDRLARGIGFIATGFERFGGIFLEASLDIPMHHQGTNLRGYPVSGVEDSVSEDGKLVAQYSDEAGYFGGTMAKARADLNKALRRWPSATQFYLLSGQKRKERAAAKFQKRVLGWKRMAGKELHLWGAVDIATRIVEDLMFDDLAARRLAHYLPELQRIRDEESFGSLAPPPDRNRLSRPNVDAEMERRLAQSPVLLLTGMSGLGKSDSARAFVQRHEEAYRLIIWLERDEVPRVEKLHSVMLERGGDTRNVAHLLKGGNCLLVIDNAVSGIAKTDLLDLCGPGSHVLLTRQARDAGSYDIPMFSRAEAEQVVAKAGEDCPPEIMDKIWATAGGHPLALNLIAAAFREGSSWTEIARECDVIGDMADGERLLSERLVGHLKPVLAKELSLFAWAGQSVCDQEFLVSELTTVGVRKLRSNSLTAADRGGIIRLHDIVFAAIGDGTWCTPERARALDDALEAYLVRAAHADELAFWKTGRVLRSKLERLVEADSRPAYRYALLASWEAAETRPELVGDPVHQAQAMVGAQPVPLGVISVIEGVEQLYLLDKLKSEAIAQANLRARLPAFRLMEQLPGLSERERIELKHHKAKALKRLGMPKKAVPLAEAVVAGTILANEARLQLMDLYRDSTPERVEQLAVEILRQAPGNGDMTHSVYLGGIERIARARGRWRAEVIAGHFEPIRTAILGTAASGLHQAYSTFASLGRYLSREMPEQFLEIFDALPAPTLELLTTDQERFAWGEIYSEAGRLPGVDSLAYFTRAKAFYDAEAKPDDFHRQRLAELLIDMGQAADAERMLRARADLETICWLQRLMARARLVQGEPQDALRWIERALASLDNQAFRSEFLELRHDIRQALGDQGAADDLRDAIEASRKPREKAELEKRLADLRPSE